MISEAGNRLIDKAEALYDEKLRSQLEATHRDSFVAIEPESGEYFLGKTLDDAVNRALDAYPTRLTYTIRIGHSAAVHIGNVCE